MVLPLPDGPSMKSISPKWATSSTPLTAAFRASPSPKLLAGSWRRSLRFRRLG